MITSEIITQIITIAAQIGIFGIASYWIQKRIDKSAQERLEEFKITLALLNAKDTKLHEKRFSAIEEIYSKLIDLENAMLELTHPVKFTNNFEENEKKLLSDAAKYFQDFSLLFQKTLIYFTEDTCQKIDMFKNKIRYVFMDYQEHKLFQKDEVEKEVYIAARKKMQEAFQSMTKEVPTLKSDLQQEFRKILFVK